MTLAVTLQPDGCCREWWLPRHLTSRWSQAQRSPGLWCRSFCVLHTTAAWVGNVSSTERSGQWDHFFLASAADFLFALFRPSYFGTLAGTDRFLLFRLPMLPASFCLFSHWPNDLGALGFLVLCSRPSNSCRGPAYGGELLHAGWALGTAAALGTWLCFSARSPCRAPLRQRRARGASVF